MCEETIACDNEKWDRIETSMSSRVSYFALFTDILVTIVCKYHF